MSEQQAIESRSRRLIAYLRYNRDQLIVDVATLLAWIVGTSLVFGWLSLPQWLYYLVVFFGIVIYAKLTPNWERPYRSQD